MQKQFTVLHQPHALEEYKFAIVPDDEAGKAALDALRHVTSLERLVDYAARRHGYQTDGYFGISYPDEIDDIDTPLAANMVRAYAGYGNPQSPEYDLPESTYLEILRQYLQLVGREDLADRF